MALIRIEKLAKDFMMGRETVHALAGVSVEIEEKSLLALIGPSGSGKSTLMNILGLLDQPTSGEYWLDGQPAARLTDDQRAQMRNQKIGFVFQSFHLLPRATALRNVEMPLIYSASYTPGFSPQMMREKARHALERVKLVDRMDHKPNELSGGQRQRVAIARALVNNPRILLADEPTGALDSKTGNEIMSLFEELNAEGVTVIIVTHDPKVAARTRRTLTMSDGVILEDQGTG